MSHALPTCGLAALLLLGGMPGALAGSEGRSLTLAEALREAEGQNLELRAARQGLERADSARRQAMAALWPTVSAGSGAWNQGSTLVQGNLEVAYSLDTHRERAARIALAEAQARASSCEYVLAYQKVRLATIEAYYDALEAAEQVRIARIDLQQAEALLRDTQALVKGGLQTIFEVQRAEVQVARARQSEEEAQAAFLIAKQGLARQLGIGGRTEVTASEAVALSRPWEPDLEASLQLAYDNRRELTLQDLRRTAAEAAGTLARSATGLETQLFGSLDVKSAVQPDSRTMLGLDGSAPGNGPSYMAGVRLAWNAFDGGASREASRQAESDATAATLRREDARLQIEFEVERLYLSLQSGRHAVELSSLILDRAQASQESARLRLKAGVGTQTDLILAQADLIQAELGRTRAILSYNRTRAALESACLQPAPRDD